MISISSYTDKLQEIKNLSIPDRKIDPEKEPVFSVNMNTRKISVPDIFRNLAVKVTIYLKLFGFLLIDILMEMI